MYECVRERVCSVAQLCLTLFDLMNPHLLNWQASSLLLSHQVQYCVMLSRFSYVQLFATLWAVVHQAPLSMGFSRQERILEWVAMPSSRGSSQHRDQICISYVNLHWQAGSLPLAPPGKPKSTVE